MSSDPLNKRENESYIAQILSKIDYVYFHYIRHKLLTHNKTVEYNGVDFPGAKVSVFDWIVPGFERGKPDYENPEADAIRTYCTEGENVVIVGGGYGITSVIAANKVSKEGKVITYEASEEMTSIARKTIAHNGVSDICEVRHTVVSEAHSTRGDVGSASVLPPDELPECDFLELDCEGAENMILKEMSIKPEVISVETHEGDGSLEETKSILENDGYHIKVESEKFNKDINHIVAIRTHE